MESCNLKKTGLCVNILTYILGGRVFWAIEIGLHKKKIVQFESTYLLNTAAYGGGGGSIWGYEVELRKNLI